MNQGNMSRQPNAETSWQATSYSRSRWDRWYPVLIALAVTAIHLALRLHLPNYIFDDTRHIYAAFIENHGLVHSIGLHDLLHVIYQEFTNQTAREYRPLSFIQHDLILGHYGPQYTIRPLLPTLIVSLGWGTLAGAHYIFARRILRKTFWSIFATLLFMTGMPILTGSWIVAMGWQWVVTLAILAGLLFYQNYKREPKLVWLVLIALTTVIGSWFREYSGLFVFIALGNELLFERKRSPALLVVLALCAFHVIFPAFLANLLLLGAVRGIALKPVYKMGPIGALSDGGWRLLTFEGLRWDALYHFVLLFPPLLWILAVVGTNLAAWRYERVFFLESRVTTVLHRVLRTIRAERLYGLVLTLLLLISASAIVSESYNLHYVLGVFALFLLTNLFILPISPLLSLYGILSFLPFLHIYLHEVHLSYAVAPVAIMLVGMVMKVWERIENLPSAHMRNYARAAVCGTIAVVAVDCSMNILASFRAVNAIYAGISTRAYWLRDQIPKGSIVVGNFIDLRDMLLYAPEHYQPYFSIAPSWEPNQVNTGAKFLALVDVEKGHTPVYLLGAVFPRAPWKYNYHHLHYLGPVVATAPVRHVFTTRIIYPYADPLKAFIPDRLTSYPGPPDLVDDYWVGRERTGSPFARELYANYLLLRVDILSESQRAELLQGRWAGKITDDYRGFNLLQLLDSGEIGQNDTTGTPLVSGGYVAFDQNAGPMNPFDLAHDATFQACATHGRCFTAPTLSCLRQRIDDLLAKRPVSLICPP